ncbi:MAG: hypothetical protein WBC71_09080 [Salaquimonas sp.]
MDILYRRFVLVAAFIALGGVVMANIIVETKQSQHLNSISPAMHLTCKDVKVCALPSNRSSAMIFVKIQRV